MYFNCKNILTWKLFFPLRFAPFQVFIEKGFDEERKNTNDKEFVNNMFV